MRDVRHIVVMDDSAYKIRDIQDAMGRLYPDAEVHVFDTANKGLSYLMVTVLEDIKANPDTWLVLADMQMPVMEGGGIDRRAGRHILNELHRRMVIHEHVSVPTVVVSGDEQDGEYLSQLYEGCLGCIHYSPFVSLQVQFKRLLEPDEM